MENVFGTIPVRQVDVVSPTGLSADYDRDNDVMYIVLGAPKDAEGEDAPRGVVYRFSMADNAPSGVTIIGFRRNGWDKNILEISALIAKHLKVRVSDVIAVIERSLKDQG